MCEGRDCVFFNDTATTEIYTLSLHDALPIFDQSVQPFRDGDGAVSMTPQIGQLALEARRGHAVGCKRRRAVICNAVIHQDRDRKSTRLNSSHANISYAVFCLKKKHPTCIHLS